MNWYNQQQKIIKRDASLGLNRVMHKEVWTNDVGAFKQYHRHTRCEFYYIILGFHSKQYLIPNLQFSICWFQGPFSTGRDELNRYKSDIYNNKSH
jgi:hypothetical protein